MLLFHLLLTSSTIPLVRCDTILLEGKRVALTQKMKESFTEACETLAGMGERVLGFVHLDLDPSRFPEGFQFSLTGTSPTFPWTASASLG